MGFSVIAWLHPWGLGPVYVAQTSLSKLFCASSWILSLCWPFRLIHGTYCSRLRMSKHSQIPGAGVANVLWERPFHVATRFLGHCWCTYWWRSSQCLACMNNIYSSVQAYIPSRQRICGLQRRNLQSSLAQHSRCSRMMLFDYLKVSERMSWHRKLFSQSTACTSRRLPAHSLGPCWHWNFQDDPSWVCCMPWARKPNHTTYMGVSVWD